MTVMVQPLSVEERNLVDLELMIMEQVSDWELDIGKVEAESSKTVHGPLLSQFYWRGHVKRASQHFPVFNQQASLITIFYLI